MPLLSVQWIAGLGFVAVAVLFATEVRKWRALTAVIGRRQRILRTCLIFLIEVLFVMMFVGPFVTRGKYVLIELLYWLVCLILGLAVLILAVFDVREVAKSYVAQSRRVFGDLREDKRREK